MDLFLLPETWIAIVTLTFLEIVLGIDNIIFISIVSNKLPAENQAKARNIGLLLALVFRVALLFGITFIIGFTKPLFTIPELGPIHEIAVSGRDLILLIGGIFLLAKSTTEIHHKMSPPEADEQKASKAKSLGMVITQIILLDLVFSFDSILTAIGLTEEVVLMIIAVILSMIVMIAFAGAISRFVNKHPTLQILALSFLILIGFMLIIDAFGFHVPKGYIYFAVAFSLFVEIINIRIRKKRTR